MTKPEKHSILYKQFDESALLAQLDSATSCPLNKALIMLCRDEMSKRISFAFAVTENNVYLTLFEKVYGTKIKYALLAQLDRASVYGTEG